MLWCMHVSIILWSVLHKQTPLRFGASDFGETPVWGMKFSWNSGSFVLRWSGVKFWYIRMKMTLEPEYHFKTSNQYDTDGIAGPKRRSEVGWCVVFFFTFMTSWIAFSSMDQKHPGLSCQVHIQGFAPQVISWFIIPLTIDISTISPSY